MLVKKITEKLISPRADFSSTDPVVVTTYYFIGIPFRKDIVIEVYHRNLK